MSEPDEDMNGHTDAPDCWCEPVLEYVTEGGCNVWVHRDPRGEPPPEVIAEAIAIASMEEV